jgi:hypothetical protein
LARGNRFEEDAASFSRGNSRRPDAQQSFSLVLEEFFADVAGGNSADGGTCAGSEEL